MNFLSVSKFCVLNILVLITKTDIDNFKNNEVLQSEDANARFPRYKVFTKKGKDSTSVLW